MTKGNPMTSSANFDELSDRMKAHVHALDKLFIGRRDAHGGWEEGRIGRNGKLEESFASYRPLTLDMLALHVNGMRMVGVYPMMEREGEFCVQWGAIDIDCASNLELAATQALAIMEAARSYDLQLIPDNSRRKGHHLWLFVNLPTPAWKVRAVLYHLVEQAGLQVKGAGKDHGIEVFPKQDVLQPDGKDLGNFVYLPWFGKLVGEGRSCFVNSEMRAIAPADQLAYAQAIVPVDLHEVNDIVSHRDLKPVNITPIAKGQQKLPKAKATAAAAADEDEDESPRGKPEPAPVDEMQRCEVGGMGSITDPEYKQLCQKLPALRALASTPQLASYDQWMAGLIHLVPFTNGHAIVHSSAFHDPARYDRGETDRKWNEALKIYARPDRQHAPSISQRLVQHWRVGGRPDITPISHQYGIQNGCFVRRKWEKSGPVWIEKNPQKLTNFTAWVVAEEYVDEGAGAAERTIRVAGALYTGYPLPERSMSSEEWRKISTWLHKFWGSQAMVDPTIEKADPMTLAAISLLSHDCPVKHVYAHTGWVDVAGEPAFLTTAGLVGATGDQAKHLEENADVRLPTALKRYHVPAAGDEASARTGYTWVEDFMRAADLEASAPLIGAMFLAPLASHLPIDFAVSLVGPTGTRKSTLAAAALTLFGREFTKDTLPVTFQSTSNAIEMMAYLAKDLPFVVDNFVPTYKGDQQTTMMRLAHAVGDHSGRARMTQARKLVESMPVRGMMVITGEDVPAGHSTSARFYTVELSHTTVKLAALSNLQERAYRGEAVGAMTHYLRWLKVQLEDPAFIEAIKQQWFAEVRAAQQASPEHGRLVEQAGWLKVGLELAKRSHPAGTWTSSTLERDVKLSFSSHALRRGALVSESSLTYRFLSGVMQLVSIGEVHACASTELGTPPYVEPGQFGWKLDENGVATYKAHSDSKPMMFVHVANHRKGAELPKNPDWYVVVQPEVVITLMKERFARTCPITESAAAIGSALDSEGFLWKEKSQKGHKTVQMDLPTGANKRVWRIHGPSIMHVLNLSREAAE